MSKTSHQPKVSKTNPEPTVVPLEKIKPVVPEIKSVVPPNQFKVLGHQMAQKMNISRSGFAIHRPGSRGR
jgi:hypothetical protein